MTDYQVGFGNHHATEALPGALPIGQNSPQKPPYGLYAEQISGTAFTAPRGENRRSWFYRIRPTVRHIGHFEPVAFPDWRTAPQPVPENTPFGPMRWDPLPLDAAGDHVLAGMVTLTTCGDAANQSGVATHIYRAAGPMGDTYFANTDGEMLFLPETGALRLRTEMGVLEVSPGEVALIPRGVKFAADPIDTPARGYVTENYGTPLTLPERGPIGANALANERDFLAPVAAYEDREGPCRFIMKAGGRFQVAEIAHCPLDVVAWHGDLTPFKYDLRRFNTIGSISFDHPDPSIFTVLTSQSPRPGTANMDFVIFPDRWLVQEDTFRPPWFHLNIMSEFMGLIYGAYDAKPGGFAPGGFSLHNCYFPHGPDAEAFEAASNADLKPQKLENTMAFMVETCLPQNPTPFAVDTPQRQHDYVDVWEGLEKKFDPSAR